MDLHYRQRGDSGDPVLIMHGLFGSLENQGGLMRALEKDYQVYGIDLRNHGKSPHVPTMGYSAMADDVIRLMDRARVDQAHLVGHSMGGKTAMQIALNYPDRVKKLCVLDIAPVQYDHHHAAILDGLVKVSQQQVSSRQEVMEKLSPFESEPAILSFLATNWRRSEDGSWQARLNIQAIVDDYDSIIAANTGSSFAGSVLFVRGGNSDYILPAHREQVLTFFPSATVRTVEGTGHWLHAEKPDMVQRIVSRFLSEG